MATAYAKPIHTSVVAVFDDPLRARAAMNDLRQAGFRDEQIGFAGPDPRRRATPGEMPNGVRDAEGDEAAPQVGAAIGAALGGTVGVIAAAGALAPIGGPVLVGGALAALAASTGAGAAAGGLFGALVSSDSEDDSTWYERQVREGRTIVTVHDADENADAARVVLRAHDGTIHEPSPVGTYGSGLPATPL